MEGNDQMGYLESFQTASSMPPTVYHTVLEEESSNALLAVHAPPATNLQQHSNNLSLSFSSPARHRQERALNEWCGDEVYKFIGDHFDLTPSKKGGGDLADVVYGAVNTEQPDGGTTTLYPPSLASHNAPPQRPFQHGPSTGAGSAILEEVSSTEVSLQLSNCCGNKQGGTSEELHYTDRSGADTEETFHLRNDSDRILLPTKHSSHSVGHKSQTSCKEHLWSSMLLAQQNMPASKADHRDKGPLLPPEKMFRHEPVTGQKQPGVFPPAALNVLEASIGSKCTDEVPFASVKVDRHGDCSNAHCATRRHTPPPTKSVNLETRWLQEAATDGYLNESWFIYGASPSIDLDGHTLKRILLSEPITMPVMAASVVLLRELECDAVLMKPGLAPRHYVHPQWATLASAGVIEGDCSLQWFTSPTPRYNVRESTLVFTPIYLHGAFSCYAFDFERCVLFIMDPRMSCVDEHCFRLHKSTIHKLLPEALRCMQIVTGKRLIGAGNWTAFVMLTARRRCSGKNTGIVAYNCMRWFNGSNVCFKERENEPKLVRRTLVYQLLHMKGNKVDISWLPAAGATYRPSSTQSSRKETE
ncbi:hypothetical protein ACP70R_034417 [Stipagrostis hirtigluma subsp. patula]